MDETTSDRLTFVATQFQVTVEWLGSSAVTPYDLVPVMDYLSALADHGSQIASLAATVFEKAGPAHPIRRIQHSVTVETALLHANDLMNAVTYFTGQAANEIHSIFRDDNS